MTRANRGYPRQPDEAYDTPPWVGTVIALWLAQQGVRSIWEPAAGQGRLASALRHLGFEVDPTTTDFYGWRHWPPETHALVTNPPYGQRGELAEAFIRRAVLVLEAPIAAFLLRVDFDSAKTRVDMFRDCPYFAGKIVLLDRITWFERQGAKPSENHAWFIWNRSHTARQPWIAYGFKAPSAPPSVAPREEPAPVR